MGSVKMFTFILGWSLAGLLKTAQNVCIDQRTWDGIFVIYTKSRQCEFLRTKAVFKKDHSFLLSSSCNGSDNKMERKRTRPGRWAFLKDSLIEVNFVKMQSMKFKIVSDSMLELQTGSKFSRPVYKRTEE